MSKLSDYCGIKLALTEREQEASRIDKGRKPAVRSRPTFPAELTEHFCCLFETMNMS